MGKWTEVRRRVLTGELSKRAACQEYGINWRTLVKMLAHAEPPGYRRKAKRAQPVVGPHLAWIHEVLEHDKQEPVKQRHTAKRIFDRLKIERDYTGGYTMVKEAVQKWKATTKEVFVPLSHPPGEAQVDFGFAYVDVAGERQQVALFVMSLPYSDTVYIQAFPRECAEAFVEGHNRAFRFIGGVPKKIRYDNSKIAVASIRDGLSNTFAVGEDVVAANHHSVAYYANGDYSSCHAPLNYFPQPPTPSHWPSVMSFRSLHPGGAHFCFADGSVHFVNETIDLGIYQGLSTKAGGEAVSLSP